MIMTTEQKAKTYDEAFERARKVHQFSSDPAEIKRMEDIFPELKENEDEKIRKALIEYFNEQCDMSDWNGIYGYQVGAWLEEQGNQRKQLIDKACNILVNYIEEYLFRRMEVWNMEGKKQILKNILRKKLEE